MKIQYAIAIHLLRWLTNFYDFRLKSTATAAIGIYPTKAWLSQLVNFKNAIWKWERFRRTICNKIVLNLEKMPQKRMECFRLIFDHLAWIEHQFLRGARDSRKAQSLWGMMRGVGGVRKSIDQSWLAKGLGLGLQCLDYLTKMGMKTVLHPPYSPDLVPCDFWRSLTCSHKRTSMGPSRSCWNSTTSALQPEEITSKGTRVSCVYYQ